MIEIDITNNEDNIFTPIKSNKLFCCFENALKITVTKLNITYSKLKIKPTSKIKFLAFFIHIPAFILVDVRNQKNLTFLKTIILYYKSFEH